MPRGGRALFASVLVVVFTLAASASLAATNHWFSGTLTPGYGYASVAANSITYIEGSGNYNGFCVAKDTGISGYDFATRTPAGTPSCATSGGYANRSENGACCYHGWISNGTSNDLLVDTSTHYSY